MKHEYTSEPFHPRITSRQYAVAMYKFTSVMKCKKNNKQQHIFTWKNNSFIWNSQEMFNLDFTTE